MPVDTIDNGGPDVNFIQGTVGANPLNTEFPTTDYPTGTILYVRDLPGNPVYELLENPVGTRFWRRVGPGQQVVTFGSSTVVNGTRTMDPGGPSRASTAGAPAATTPSMVFPYAIRVWGMSAVRTNSAAGPTIVATVFSNFVATTSTVTLASTVFSNSATLVIPVSIAAGTRISVQAVAAGGTSSNVVVSVFFEAQP